MTSAWNSVIKYQKPSTSTTEAPTAIKSKVVSKGPKKSFIKVKSKHNPTPSASTTTTVGIISDTSSDESTERTRRRAETVDLTTTETAVAEGRYIKGDPLKGYYDFVITEGSYKFWAVFQVRF